MGDENVAVWDEDLPTPEEIENARFPDVEIGYDKARVDGFLLEVAREVRHLLRRVEIAEGQSNAPLRRFGDEIADLLRHAVSIAENIKKDARKTRSKAEEAAHRIEAEAEERAAGIVSEAEQRARDVDERASFQAERVKEEAAHLRRLAEVQVDIERDDTARELRRIRQEARDEVSAMLARAREEQDRLGDRIRVLRETEATLTRRVKALMAHLDGLRDDAGHPVAPAEQEIYLTK